MPKEELLQFEGLVIEILPDARYRGPARVRPCGIGFGVADAPLSAA